MKKLIAILLCLLCYSAEARNLMVVGGGVPVAGGATISAGTFQKFTGPTGDYEHSLNATIPVGTTVIVVAVGGYGFHTGEPLYSGTLGAQNFTVDQALDATNDAGVGIGHLFSPASTGAQTIVITTGLSGYDSEIYLIYYSGTATDGLRDSDEYEGTSLTLTTSVGDRVVAIGVDIDNVSISWTNATEIDETQSGSGFGISTAQLSADGASETVTMSGTNCAITAIVLKPGS